MTFAEREHVSARSAADIERWIPPQTRQRGLQLFDQQFWLWGQDVATVPGNGLVHYGFHRHAPPSGARSTSCYVWEGPVERMTLWGFGLLYAQLGLGSMFLRRYRFAPCLISCDEITPNCWGLEELPRHAAPANATEWGRALELVEATCRWIVAYETWAQQAIGPELRQASLSKWKKRCSSAENLPADWELVADSIHQARESSAVETTDSREQPPRSVVLPPLSHGH
ncbi:MAG: hypothetical protein SFV23_00960 [Planctomycetaceae bacterium]|nr:hypothetical protein [Planctomycetaceae bacterium]